jgi:acetyl esterase/lipase
MTYAFDAGILQALAALAASAGTAPLTPAARDDWKTLRANSDAAFPLFSAALPEHAPVSRADYSAVSHDGFPVALRWYVPEEHGTEEHGTEEHGTEDHVPEDHVPEEHGTEEHVGPAAVFLHGGGMIMGSVELSDRFVAAYVAGSGVPMLAVSIRAARTDST